ncbi:MAG: hypothetical protein ACTSWP_06625 [Candidatus Freyarchaeota archaeon]
MGKTRLNVNSVNRAETEVTPPNAGSLPKPIFAVCSCTMLLMFSVTLPV